MHERQGRGGIWHTQSVQIKYNEKTFQAYQHTYSGHTILHCHCAFMCTGKTSKPLLWTMSIKLQISIWVIARGGERGMEGGGDKRGQLVPSSIWKLIKSTVSPQTEQSNVVSSSRNGQYLAASNWLKNNNPRDEKWWHCPHYHGNIMFTITIQGLFVWPSTRHIYCTHNDICYWWMESCMPEVPPFVMDGQSHAHVQQSEEDHHYT